jgi:hypothetical protein
VPGARKEKGREEQGSHRRHREPFHGRRKKEHAPKKRSECRDTVFGLRG